MVGCLLFALLLLLPVVAAADVEACGDGIDGDDHPESIPAVPADQTERIDNSGKIEGQEDRDTARQEAKSTGLMREE